MLTIDNENAKIIREPFEVHCGIAAEDKTKNMDILGYYSEEMALRDVNFIPSLKESAWPALPVADLSDGGFTLDAGAAFPVNDDSHVGGDSGKYGIQSYVGEGLRLRVSTNSIAVSMIVEGEGTLTAGTHTYSLQHQMVVAMEMNTTTLITITNSNPNKRVIIYTVVPGVVLQFSNENLIAVTLDLAGDLKLDNPSFETSSIDIKAYYPEDISDVVSQVEEDAPLWYYAGYPGNYSETRYFYLDGDATQDQDGTLNIQGVDASHRLEDRSVMAAWLHTGRADDWEGAKELYTTVKSVIEKAGIKILKYTGPGLNPQNDYYLGEYGIIPDQDAKSFLGKIMIETHTAPQSYWITYVDAGIPSLCAKYKLLDGIYCPQWQSQIWTIREEDCTDIQRNISKKIKTIKSDEDGVPLYIYYHAVNGEHERFGYKKDAKANRIYYADTGGKYIMHGDVLNSKKVYWISATGAKWKTKKAGPTALYGKVLEEEEGANTATYNQNGITLAVSPAIKGRIKAPGGTLPYHTRRFVASNITGSFKFRGDPRMQPRDVFKFVRLDGTEETATIERIEMTHEGGGTTATISYRLGVM